MPPKAKISRQMILDTALKLVREAGPDAINVRSLAKELNCSTQPIMYNFKTSEELKKAVYDMAEEYNSDYIQPKGDRYPLLELSLNYIRFAHEEKNLFRFLFQAESPENSGLSGLLNSPSLKPIQKMVAHDFECSKEGARRIILSMFVTAHGCASLIVSNSLEYDEKFFIDMLENSVGVI